MSGANLTRPELCRFLRDQLAQPSGSIAAVKWLIKHFVKKKPKKLYLTEEIANEYLLSMIRQWMDQGDYLNAARLLWSEQNFSLEPESVRQIWSALPLHAEVMVQGAGSLGKTITAANWFMLDWLRDPEHTCVKVISLTGQHAKRNCFAQIKNLHQSSAVKLCGEVSATSIQVGSDDKQGIHLLAIPKGNSGVGSLRGFHTMPRTHPHPIFGNQTRIRVLMDEAEEIPFGVWEGVNNILAGRNGVEHIKIYGASNPRDRNSKFGLKCEPRSGWGSVNMGEDDHWESKSGSHVICLDGARCKNVIERRVVYEGLLTWEGYKRFLDMGEDHPEYLTMARGWFPTSGLAINVIPHDMVTDAMGTFRFYGKTIYAAGVDLAFEGGDRAVMTIGRFGQIIERGEKGNRFGLEINRQFLLTNRKTEEMCKEIMQLCKNLHIEPSWLCVDRTGNGTGVHDLLCNRFGSDVMGVQFGSKSTDTFVLSDDSEKACDLYDGLVTEVWFAMRKWLEFGFLKFGPACEMDDLRSELTNRRYRQRGDKVRVESKGDYKARGFRSCDLADSLSLLLHLVRIRAENFDAYMSKPKSYDSESQARTTGHVDKIEFVDFSGT